MSTDTAELNYLWGKLIIEELSRQKVRFICLAPGSRCTPLSIAVAEHPKMEVVVHYDERGAAFHALGYARSKGSAAVIITTSGTAVANCLPAIVEAKMDRVPLILLSVDLPPELQQTGAKQSIQQDRICSDYTKFHFNIPCPTLDMNPAALLTLIDQAVYQANRPSSGPVQLNCMYREPFLPEPNKKNIKPNPYPPALELWYKSNNPYVAYHSPQYHPDNAACERIRDRIQKASRGLVLLGAIQKKSERLAILKLINKLKWPVIADIQSGLRLGRFIAPSLLIPYHDLLLASEAFVSHFHPDCILQFGTHFISKRIIEFIHNHPNIPILQIKNHSDRDDPCHHQSEQFEIDIQIAYEAIIPASNKAVNWFAFAQDLAIQIDHFLNKKMTVSPEWSEAMIARCVSLHLTDDSALFLSSSLPIRMMDSFAVLDGPMALIASNRGANGIDGIIATAAGYARSLGKSVTLFIGDLAFLHDLNSLALVKQSPIPLRIVLINNNGGGIFSLLPIARDKAYFERYFVNPHHLDLSHAATLFKLKYEQPQTLKTFIKVFRNAQCSESSTLIEIKIKINNHAAFLNLLKKEILTSI